jgi:hypothetical protein
MSRPPRPESGRLEPEPPERWRCLGCGTLIEPQFAACWRCGTSRDGKPNRKFKSVLAGMPTKEPRCGGCGLPLGGLVGRACPECGRAFEADLPAGTYPNTQDAKAQDANTQKSLDPRHLWLNLWIVSWLSAIVGAFWTNLLLSDPLLFLLWMGVLLLAAAAPMGWTHAMLRPQR